jgi:REP element-mobilizing transposase RayT
MARLPRYVIPGQPQHIIQRGNNRQPIFAAEAGSYMVRPAMQGKSSFVAKRILRPYIRPWDEASCRLWP